jgi:iron complex transport system substrate-binding protein
MTRKKSIPPRRPFPSFTRALAAAVRSAAFLPAAALLLAGCGGNGAAGRTDNRTAEEGKAITRIISTAPSNTEIIAGLGLTDKLIAADKYSLDIPGVSQDLVRIDFFNPDAEAILTLNPDIIISNEHNAIGGDDPFALIKEAGIRVVYIPTSFSIEGIYADIEFIAETLGVAERGAELTAAMKSRIEEIRKIGASIPPEDKKSVYFEISPAPYLYSLGRNTFLNDMIETAGAKNIFEDITGWLAPGAEAIIEKNPDVILTSVNHPEALEELKNRAGFEHIRAVLHNELYQIDANSASRPSQHIVIALSQMAKAIYPGKYAEL